MGSGMASKTIPKVASELNTNVYDDVSDLTTAKVEIIEYIARNPSATNREIVDAVGYSLSYPSKVKDQHSDLIFARAKELGSDIEELRASDERRQKKRSHRWDDLKEKQQAVLMRLAEEDDPHNPSSSLREIGEDVSRRENISGKTYPAYVSDVKEKYGHFAVKLKKARKRTESDEEAFEIVDSITLDTENNGDKSVNEANITGFTESQIKELKEYVQMQKGLAESEMNIVDDNEIATGRYIMAEQFENELNKLLSE